MQLLKFDIPGAGRLLTKTWALQRTYNWQIMMPWSIKGLLGPFVSQYCQDVKFGDYSITDVQSMRYGAFQRFYAGLEEIETVSLAFLWPVDNSVYDFFRSWRELVRDKDGYYNPKKEYAKTMYVMMYDRSGVQSVQITLHGVFPKTLPSVSLSYGDDSILKWGPDLNVDYIEVSSFIGGIQQAVVGAVGGVLNDVTGGAVGKVAGGVMGAFGG